LILKNMATHEVIKDAEPTGADKAKLIAAIVLVIAGLAGYYALDGQPAWMRWGAVVGGLVLGALTFAWSRHGSDVWQFILDSRIELRKIVWPNKQETMTTTLVVFGFVVVAGLFFWLLDLVLAWATRALTGQGG
jgi:preprotein translocase subunit SecE